MSELPPFASAQAIRRRAAEALLPPRRVTVSEAAAKWRRVNSPAYTGPWRNETAPYMVAPMDATTSRAYEAVCYVGPAQSLKTDALILNTTLHSVVCDPKDTLIVQMTQGDARDFSRSKLDRMVLDCAAMKARLTAGAHRDNVHDKQFNGMLLRIGWPSISQLSSKSVSLVLLTDYDRMPESVDGEGSAFSLAQQRTKSFGQRGMTVVESSPGRDVIDADLVKLAALDPHEAPPTTGIFEIYNQGTRRRWYWPCPDCGEHFIGSFDRLHWDAVPEVEDAAASVAMICPHCGSLIPEAEKRGMNARGVWLAQGQAIDRDGVISGAGRRSTTDSYWLDGPAAVFQRWAGLVRRYLNAKATLEKTGSEEALRATVNTDQAKAYVPAAAKAAKSVDAVSVAERARRDLTLGAVPMEARFLTAAVDTQSSRFVIQVQAWGATGESWVVEHREISRPADGADRFLDPAANEADWDLLTTELTRRWPLADGSGRTLRLRTLGVDMHGEAGVTPQAYAWWRRLRKAGLVGTQHLRRAILLRGDSQAGKFTPRIRITMPDSARKDRMAQARGEIPILQIHPDRVKDEVFAAINAGKMFFPAALADLPLAAPYFEQLTAEKREASGRWTAVRKRNEAFDLSVYNRALWLLAGADKINWDAPQSWARPLDQNSDVGSGDLLSSAPPPAAAAPNRPEIPDRSPPLPPKPIVAAPARPSPAGRVIRMRERD